MSSSNNTALTITRTNTFLYTLEEQGGVGDVVLESNSVLQSIFWDLDWDTQVLGSIPQRTPDLALIGRDVKSQIDCHITSCMFQNIN